MKQIILMKKDNIDEETKEMIKQHDMLLIECESVYDVKIVTWFDSFEGDVFVDAMMESILSSSPVRPSNEYFGKIFLQKLKSLKEKSEEKD